MRNKAVKELASAIPAVNDVVELSAGEYPGTLGHVIAARDGKVYCCQKAWRSKAMSFFVLYPGEYKLIGHGTGWKFPDSMVNEFIQECEREEVVLKQRISQQTPTQKPHHD